MLKFLETILGTILPLIVLILGIYGYLTNEKGLVLHYMYLFLGLMYLMTGIREFLLKQKRSVYINFFVALFSFVAFFIFK